MSKKIVPEKVLHEVALSERSRAISNGGRFPDNPRYWVIFHDLIDHAGATVTSRVASFNRKGEDDVAYWLFVSCLNSATFEHEGLIADEQLLWLIEQLGYVMDFDDYDSRGEHQFQSFKAVLAAFDERERGTHRSQLRMRIVDHMTPEERILAYKLGQYVNARGGFNPIESEE